MGKTWISPTAGNHRIQTTVVEGGISHERAKTEAQGAKAGNETVDVDWSCACLACSLRAHNNALCS